MAALRIRRRLAARVYYGWVIAVACLLGSVVVFGTTYSFGVFFEAMLGAFEASRATLSLVFGVHTFVLYVGATVAGGLVDRYGPRRMLLAGGAVLVCGLAATSRVRTFGGLVAVYGVVVSLGLSVLYVVAYATVPRWFGRRRGTANGLATAGLGVGLVVVSPAAAALIDAVGWRGAYVALAGGIALLVGVVALLFADRPEDVGADPSPEFPSAASDGRRDRGVDADALRAVVRTPSFLLVFVGWVFVYGVLYVVINHLVLHVTDVGLPRSVGVTAIAVLGVATTLARLGLGTLSDRIGRVRLFVACSTLMALSTLALGGLGTPVPIFVAVATFGVGYGGNGALLSPLVADLFGGERLNTLYGALSIAFAISGLAAPPLAGVAVERLGSYAPVFAAFGVAGVVGAGCIHLAGRVATDVEGRETL